MSNLTKYNFPPLDVFLKYNNSEITNFCNQNNISTCYLPIDGTRRYFLLITDFLNEWSETNFQKYFQVVNSKFRDLLTVLFDFGLKNIIFLLMDKSAFSRGKNYLAKTVEYGIQPLYKDDNYLNLYKEYNINVYFSGFTSIYTDYYSEEELTTIKTNFDNLKINNSKRNLIIYNGLSPSEDYLLLEKLGHKLRLQNIEITKENLVQSIYGTPISSIDFSIWYGYPRDKIIPPLLWEDGPRFFTKNPTLSLNNAQIKKTIYYSALTKKSYKDNYFSHSFSKIEKQEKQIEILTEESVLGQDYYYLS